MRSSVPSPFPSPLLPVTVTPEDIAATIDTILGIPHDAEIVDTQGRPHRVQIGQPINALVE